jgi:hypothetical protein
MSPGSTFGGEAGARRSLPASVQGPGRRRRGSITLGAVLLAVGLSSCSSENPVSSGPDPTCDHVDTDGFFVSRGAVLALQWQGDVTGSLAVGSGEQLDSYLVTWLRPDSTAVPTSAFCAHEVRWEVADTTIARLHPDAGNVMGFHLEGRNAGTTTVRIRLWHNDHADFTSLPIEIVVGASPAPTLGVKSAVLFKGASRIASWDWHVAGAFGVLYVPLGETTWPIGVQFLDSLEQAVSPGMGYSLAWQVSDPSVASLQAEPGSPWDARLQGLGPGSTNVTFTLLRSGLPEFATGSIDVVVHDTTSAPSQPVNFVVRKSGVRNVFVENGIVVPSCGTTMSIGFLPAKADTVEDLFNFRLTTPPSSCSGVVPGSSSTYRLVYEFGAPGIAGIVGHPEHVGEYFDFHLRGLAVGETTLRIVLMSGSSVAFRSPPLPVHVTATGSAPWFFGSS